MIELQTFLGGLFTGIFITLVLSVAAIYFYKTEIKGEIK